MSTRGGSIDVLFERGSTEHGSRDTKPIIRENLSRALRYTDLPNATSIRLLEIIEASSDTIRCMMRVVDLEEDIKYAALSYTWGNPITIHEEPAPDLDQWKYPEEADKFPFTYSTPPLGPKGQILVGVDGAKRDYLSLYPYIPREKVEWNQGTPHTIEVNGCDVTVDENLFLYLSAVGTWRAWYGTQGEPEDVYQSFRLPIWIDALCIDQSNLLERALQVQLMGRIYKSASVVLSWIGESDRLSTISFDAAKIILDYDATRNDAIFTSAADETIERLKSADVLLSLIPGMNVVHWFSIFSLLQRLYFRRAWIAQEIIFAKDVLVVSTTGLLGMDLLLSVFTFIVKHGLDHELCRLGRNILADKPQTYSGYHLLRLSSFRKSMPPNIENSLGNTTSTTEVFEQAHEQRFPLPGGLKIDPKNAFSFILGYHQARGRLGISDAGKPIVRSKSPSTQSQREGQRGWDVNIPECINLADHTIEWYENGEFHNLRRHPLRLLSVLSLFRNMDATDPRDKIFAFLNLATDDLGVVPDYHATVQDVYRDTTMKMMLNTGSLSVLSQIQDDPETRIRNLPGWVPDFSARLERIPFDQGGEACHFCASPQTWDTTRIIFSDDGSLGIEGFQVDSVSQAIDIEEDPVFHALRLALNAPETYPGEPLTWWSLEYDSEIQRELLARTVNRVEALWRTLIADDLTERREDHELIDTIVGLSSGFVSWIIADFVEARQFLEEYIDVGPDDWVGRLIYASFCTRMAVWSAGYDGKQVSDFGIVRDFEATVADLRTKTECENSQRKTVDNPDLSSRNPSISRPKHFPTAQQISSCLNWKFEEPVEECQNSLMGPYRMSALLRLTPLQRRELRMFEKAMRRATEGRRLFCTRDGRFGLGPKTTGQEAGFNDEIWILYGAKVPFILRHEEGSRYRIVGEAYVHGLMYGEEGEDGEYIVRNIDLV